MIFTCSSLIVSIILFQLSFSMYCIAKFMAYLFSCDYSDHRLQKIFKIRLAKIRHNICFLDPSHTFFWNQQAITCATLPDLQIITCALGELDKNFN